MKVCDLALFSPETSSGVKTHIANKIDYVSSREHIEHVVIVPGKEDRVSAQGRSKVIMVRGVRSFYPGIHIGINIGRIARIVENESPDVIELNCQYTLGWAAFLATRRRRTPIVGVYHTDVPACARHWARHAGHVIASTVERVVEVYEGLIYRHCTATIILNAAMSDRVKRLGVRRVHCLPCAVDAAMFHPKRRDPDLRVRLGIAPEQKAILYAGRLSPEKELDVLFAAHDRLSPRDFVLLIAGDGPGVEAVKRHAAAHPGVKYLGHVESRADLAALYASSDIFVTPGRYETFGMATLEAISCGLPVVGIRDSGTATLVPPQIGRLVRAGDAADMAGSISTIAAWCLDRTREVCHAFASERFSRDVVFDQYFGIYRDLIDAASRQERTA
jgi:alpha-1,6-mannosyltransferase